VSSGAFAELNLSSDVGDDPSAVAANWRRVVTVSGNLPFARMRQVHGDRVVRVTTCDLVGGEADAMFTSSPGVLLSVLTADCVPILIVDPVSRNVAAVHTGWRGTLSGVVVRALDRLRTVGGVTPQTLLVAMGPAIGGCCYEVGADIAMQLERRWGVLPGAVSSRVSTKIHLDLRAANAALLMSAGVPRHAIAIVGPCTRCAASEYFSYRAAGGITGRQLSFVGWLNFARP
jgi:YfiH family protein